MLFDTNFLIALQRGTKSAARSRAKAFLEAQPPAAAFYISRVTWMEFVAGFETSSAALPYLSLFTLIEVDALVWWDASRVVRSLGLRGKRIGAADSIIAATAIHYGLPVVTNNTKHFREVIGLDVRQY